MDIPRSTGNHARLKSLIAFAVTLFTASLAHTQEADELEQLKMQVQELQQTLEGLNSRISAMERSRAGDPREVMVTETNELTEAGAPELQASTATNAARMGRQSAVAHRRALNDNQSPAARPKDFALHPTLDGFIPIPNTPAQIKFNAKPRLDMIADNRFAGTDSRFVPALFPLEGDPDFGGGEEFSMNANGSQLSLDVRVPDLPGNLRLYYQNDFFGSASKAMQYRLQQFYGIFHGFKAGFTYGVWEDPDVWPDTVDYEGPNAAIYARRPVFHYTASWSEHWHTTFGVENPEILLDGAFNTNAVLRTAMPDLGFNTRFEKQGFGHVQFSALFRDIGATDDAGLTQHVLGWGVNLGAGIDLSKRDSLQLLGAYGEGVGGLGNDTGWVKSDASFASDGTLEALPYWSVMAGLTHHWNDQFRSTATYGFVNLDNTSGQEASFFHRSQYASVNLVWQFQRHLSVGVEGLYGYQEANAGADSGDHWRLQLGLLYALFE